MVALNSVEMDDEIRSDAALRTKVEHANEVLTGIVRGAAPRTRVRWRLSRDSGGRRLLGLNLSDYTGSAGADLDESDLDDESQLWFRLHRVWGDLLQDRSHRELARLHEMVLQLGDE